MVRAGLVFVAARVREDERGVVGKTCAVCCNRDKASLDIFWLRDESQSKLLAVDAPTSLE